MQRLEALVVGVGEYAHCEDVEVAFPYPGHLAEKEMAIKCIITLLAYFGVKFLVSIS